MTFSTIPAQEAVDPSSVPRLHQSSSAAAARRLPRTFSQKASNWIKTKVFRPPPTADDFVLRPTTSQMINIRELHGEPFCSATRRPFAARLLSVCRTVCVARRRLRIARQNAAGGDPAEQMSPKGSSCGSGRKIRIETAISLFRCGLCFFFCCGLPLISILIVVSQACVDLSSLDDCIQDSFETLIVDEITHYCQSRARSASTASYAGPPCLRVCISFCESACATGIGAAALSWIHRSPSRGWWGAMSFRSGVHLPATVRRRRSGHCSAPRCPVYSRAGCWLLCAALPPGDDFTCIEGPFSGE